LASRSVDVDRIASSPLPQQLSFSSDVALLDSNRTRMAVHRHEELRKTEKYLARLFAKAATDKAAGLRGDFVTGISSLDFVELTCFCLMNGFGCRSRQGDEVAASLYPTAAYFNHSCSPTVTRVLEDGPGGSARAEHLPCAVPDPAA
jgi:hypothetical protein